MKRIFVFLSIVINFVSLSAQEYAYEYDASGNRISRNLVHLSVANSPNSINDVGSIKQNDAYNNIYEFETASQNLNISVFPNPVEELLLVSFSQSDIKVDEVRVYDMNAKLIWRKKNLEGELKIPFVKNKPSNYIVWIKFNDKIERFKVVKD